MRIISGSRRGKKLLPPVGDGTRPTTDRVKESVFNIIQSYLPSERVLDLFAGSGALGIEALSRGSSHAVFIDNSRDALSVCRRNIENSRFEEKSSVIQTDALGYLEKCTEYFDIIFLDPPYNRGLLTRAAALIEKRGLLAEGGIMVCETEVGGEVPSLESTELIRSASYGKTSILIYRR